MDQLRNILPGALRRAIRVRFDDAMSRHDLPVVKVGETCPWHVIPSSLGEGANLLSGGAGNDISFELAMASDYKCRVAIFDPSPTGRETFLRNTPAPERISFHTAGLAASSTTLDFDEPDDPREGSYKLESKATNARRVSFPCLSPRDAMKSAGMSKIDLLKIDIEGFEYDFLAAMLVAGIRPGQIAVEFHHFMHGMSRLDTIMLIMRLRCAGYRLVHKRRHDYLFVQQELVERLMKSSGSRGRSILQ